MAYNEAGTYFVTGSEDATIFFFAVHSKMLTPIGFVEVGGPVVKVQWTPNTTTSQGDVIVFLRQGCVVTIPCPSLDEVDQTKSFALLNIQPTGGYRLLSIKSKLLHEEQSMEKLKRYEFEKKARQELRAARAEREPETEEDAQRLDDEEELIRQGILSEIADWAPSYPAEPSPITYASLDPLDPKQFWLAFDDYDAGYLYQCKLGNPPVSDEEAKLIIKRKKAEKAALLRAVATKDELDDSGSTDRKEDLESEETDESDLQEVESRDLEFADHLEEAEPVASAKFDNNDETTITCWTFSSSGYRLFAGLKDGCIRVQLLERPFDMTSFKGFWLLRIHDNKRGAVTRITLTHDEKFVISVSQDGTFFVYDLMSEELQNKEMKEYRARIPSAYEATVPADDIVDPKARSIEQAKQKAEYDRLMNLVEQKKAETRKKVTELRLRFKHLKEQNEKLPERIRLGKEEFDLVPHIRTDLLKERAAKIDLVYRETAWMSEKYRLALEKLENAFQRSLDCDRILVRAFSTGHCVSSVRTNKLSNEHVRTKEALQQAKAEQLARKVQMDQQSAPRSIQSNQDDSTAQKKITSESSQQQMKGARGLRVARKLHVLEEAQRRRQARRAQWEQLEAMKPADNYEDPEDLKAIALAKENMGDFKLKSAQNYIVSDRSKLNAFGAKCRLVEMTEEAFNLRNSFNKTLVALRDKKIHLIKEFHRINELLQDIQCDLPEGEPAYKLEIPFLSSEEYPEREFTYTNSDLLRFKREREELTEAQSSQSATKSLATITTKASSKQGGNAIVHVFSEALYPQSMFRSGPDIEEEESQSLPGRTSRQVILIPLHSLALELCLVSLRKQLTQCALKQPLLTGLVGTPIPELIPLDEKQMEGFDGVRLIKTTSPVRPDPVSVSHTYIKPADTEEDDGDRDLNRRAIKAAVTPESDSQRQVPAIEGRQTTSQSPDSEFKVSGSVRPALPEAYHMESAEQKRRQIQALYQRQELINSVGRLVRCFDAEVRMTRHARFKLDVLLKRTELHQLTLFEEFRLLKDFEKSEMVLTERKQLRDSEKSEVNFKISELNSKIDMRKKEIERLTQREHALHEEFKASLGEGHRFTDFLTRVFKKRIKRKKQESAEAGSDESADSSSSSSDESSFDESEDESDEDENILDLDTCPVGCPLEDYENTCAIRERRLDVEEDISEEKKALDLLKKDLESWSKKQRIVEAAQKQAHSELEAFQLEKQRKLNELDTVVILRLNQIEYHLNCSVPADLSAGLIFERCNLDILHQRIRELQDEKKQQRREQKEAKDRHVMLQKHKRLFQKELEKMTTVCDNEMIDKFGKIDNIERMESVVVNPKLEELTTKMLILQEEFEKEELDMEEQIRKARDNCIAQIRENTAVLSQTLMLFNEKEHLQSDLNNKQGAKIGYIDTSDNQMETKEIQRLTELVKTQEKEISQLSQELDVLTRVSLTGFGGSRPKNGK
ncbi:WD repeat-containing protein 52 [Paragonimus skrjabini miyazakii]|uniref:WD repeat-containing protein 52 n=1 Tax=Paragonimus skrjabini miyazakii TaxID=59628 RepID=A0A8S9YAQ5_9TREM|nr:WD repeat-containing protein 52 [Paragonimus skrjabini miyazakii]